MGIGLTIFVGVFGTILFGVGILALLQALSDKSLKSFAIAVPTLLVFGGFGAFCLLGAGSSAYDYLIADDATLLGIAEGWRSAGWIRESGRGNACWIDAATILSRRGNQELADNVTIGNRLIGCVSSDLRENDYLREEGEKALEILRKFPKEKLIELICADLEQTRDGDNTFVLVGKLAVAGTEEVLVRALNDYGTKKMAEDLLNSGSQELSEVAVNWCRERGYPIRKGYGSNRFTWH